MSNQKYTNIFFWIAHYFNEFVKQKLSGKLEISFDEGVVVFLRQIIKPKSLEKKKIVEKWSNVFYWLAFYFNEFIKQKWYGKLIIVFEHGVVVDFEKVINRKPPPNQKTKIVEYKGMKISFENNKENIK